MGVRAQLLNRQFQLLLIVTNLFFANYIHGKETLSVQKTEIVFKIIVSSRLRTPNFFNLNLSYLLISREKIHGTLIVRETKNSFYLFCRQPVSNPYHLYCLSVLILKTPINDNTSTMIEIRKKSIGYKHKWQFKQ